MSVSLREVLEHSGYDIATAQDARWLVSKQSEFNTLVEEAEQTIEEAEQSDEN